nr:unnamed protein product [Callosobruchus analis]
MEEKNNTEAASLYSDLYKCRGKSQELSQQQRRDQFLKDQKERRHRVTDQNRKVCEFLLNDMCLDEDTMQWDSVNPRNKRKRVVFKLMLSEWLTEVPDDLEENWLTKFVPEGCRILLIATRAQTNCYNSKGRYYFNIKSGFPGGNHTSPTGTTVLDCIYNKYTKVIFILDCLFWNSMSMSDSEAQFRFFWLKNKFSEMPDLARYGSYQFILLDYFSAEKGLIQDIMSEQTTVKDQKLPYDGVVFYHKECHYFFGYTPLVGWLASYMLPEKLNIDVPQENMARKPKDYVCMEKYLEDLEIKKKAAKTRKKKNNVVDEEMV